MSFQRVAIIGGGVSGLSAGYYLSKYGIDAVLIEKEARTGGLIRTERFENCLLEAGPDSFLSAKPAVNELAAEIETLQRQIISSNDAARRVFIVRRGELVPFPHGMSMMVPGELGPALASKLFRASTKLRFITERFHRPKTRATDVPVGDFVREHFGPELLEYVADPLLAGVYGGDATNLSARSVLPRFLEYEERFGSLIRGVRAQKKASGALFQSFAGGMQALTDALWINTDHKRVLSEREEAVRLDRMSRGWRIWLTARQMQAEHVIVAVPTYAAARLLERAAPELASELAAIPYSSAILATILYDASRIEHPLDGFGFLVPRRERRTIAAATWINRKFPTRIAPGTVAIRAFIVGEEAIRLAQASDAELAALVQRDLQSFMQIEAEPRKILLQRWPNSMPQYVVGHGARLQRVRQLTAELPGLHLIGNAYEGVGIPDCVRLGKAAADQIAADIKTL